MSHFQQDEFLLALQDTAKYPYGLCLVDPRTNNSVLVVRDSAQLFVQTSTGRQDSVPALKDLEFSFVSREAINPFNRTREVFYSARRSVQSLEEAALVAFAVVKNHFKLSDDGWLFITPDPNPDSWSREAHQEIRRRIAANPA